MNQPATNDAALARRNGNPTALIADSGFRPGEDAGTVAMAARAQREVEAAVMLARANPRDETYAMHRVDQACHRPRLADRAVYAFPRGKETITGPSVVLAREIARCWGNIRYGFDMLPAGDDMLHIKGWAWDVETNTRVEGEDRFKPLIQRKDYKTGRTSWVEPNERDLRELVNRRAAFAVRNCLLQLLPADVVDDAVQRCNDTMKKSVSGQLGEDRVEFIRATLRVFGQLGVTKEMIDKKLGHPIDEVSPEQMVELRAIHSSMEAGNSKRADHFEFGDPAEKMSPTGAAADLNAEVKATAKKAAEPAKPTVDEEKAAAARAKAVANARVELERIKLPELVMEAHIECNLDEVTRDHIGKILAVIEGIDAGKEPQDVLSPRAAELYLGGPDEPDPEVPAEALFEDTDGAQAGGYGDDS